MGPSEEVPLSQRLKGKEKRRGDITKVYWQESLCQPTWGGGFLWEIRASLPVEGGGDGESVELVDG